MARANNFPQAGLEKIDPKTVQAITMSLVDLYNKGKPKTDNEVRQRVNEYFEYCQASSLRPGVETLRTALHVSRSTLYEWSQGRNCSSERAEIIQGAKSIIDSFLEQALINSMLPDYDKYPSVAKLQAVEIAKSSSKMATLLMLDERYNETVSEALES